MATSKVAEKNTEQQEEKVLKAAQESVYTVNEFADSSQQVFSVRRECVIAAFLGAGKESATITEAKKIVETFLKQEVK